MDRKNALAGFSGAYRDRVTLAHPLGNGYRWYLPWLMRFNAPDSSSPFGAGGIHAYAYCGADPINRTDASGHTFEAVDTMLALASNGLATGMMEEMMPAAMKEASSSLAAEASKGAAQEATASTSSAGAPGTENGRLAKLRRLGRVPDSLVLPNPLGRGAVDTGSVDQTLTTYRATAAGIEHRARVLQGRWPTLMAASAAEYRRSGRPDTNVAQRTRFTVQGIAEDAAGLLEDLYVTDTQLRERPGEFENQREEIRGLQGRIRTIRTHARQLYLRLVDERGDAAFGTGWGRDTAD